MKLNLGCGLDRKPGWVNVDSEKSYPVDVYHDLSQGIPVETGKADFIYTEHFIEHLNRPSGVAFLRECHRALRPGGVVRLSTPDLFYFTTLYRAAYQGDPNALNTWEIAKWVPKTPAQMMNEEFRMWGHQFIYDCPELLEVLGEAGFSQKSRVQWGKSEYPELCNLEVRPEAWLDLQVEAVK